MGLMLKTPGGVEESAIEEGRKTPGVDPGDGLHGKQRWYRRMFRALYRRLRAPFVWLSHLKAWQLALLGVFGLLLVVWGGVSASGTSVYDAQVLVTDGRIGVADPNSLFDFGDLPQNGAIDHKLTLKNDGVTPTFVMVGIFGGIRDFISIEDAFFKLNPGDERTVLVHMGVPATAEVGKTYSGKVIITRLPIP